MSAQKTSVSSSASLAILGGGNLGQALARGLVRSGTLQPDQIHVTSLHPPSLDALVKLSQGITGSINVLNNK